MKENLFSIFSMIKLNSITRNINDLVDDLNDFNNSFSLGFNINDTIELKNTVNNIKSNLLISQQELTKKITFK